MFDPELKADDVGTRLEHLMELHDLWGWSLHMCLRGTFHTDLETAQQAKLECALEMLNHIIMGYQGATDVPSVINSLPRDPKEIPNDTIAINDKKIT